MRPLWRGSWEQHASGAPAPDRPAVLHETDTRGTAHLVLAGAGGAVLEDLGTLAHAQGAQFTYTAITRRWVAFVYVPTNQQQAQQLWRLYLYDRQRHTLKVVAHYSTDGAGRPLPSGWVRPILTDRYLYWIQSVPDTTGWGGSEAQQYTLANGRIRTLYRGLTTSMTVYRNQLLFTAIQPNTPRPSAGGSTENPPMRIDAVDEQTGRTVRPPIGITAGADAADTIVSYGDLLVWNTADARLRAWRHAWAKSVTIVPAFGDTWPAAEQLGITGGPAYPRLYGHFLVWQPGHVWVLDLRTNTIAKLSTHDATEEMSGSVVSFEQNSAAQAATDTSGRTQLDETLLDLAHLPDLPMCRPH